MQVKSIAECSKGSILHYFRPPLSYHFALIAWFCLFFKWPLKTSFTVLKNINKTEGMEEEKKEGILLKWKLFLQNFIKDQLLKWSLGATGCDCIISLIFLKNLKITKDFLNMEFAFEYGIWGFLIYDLTPETQLLTAIGYGTDLNFPCIRDQLHIFDRKKLWFVFFEMVCDAQVE